MPVVASDRFRRDANGFPLKLHAQILMNRYIVAGNGNAIVADLWYV
jgi:hypothetical protein